ncbi:hypothetical protein B9W61_18925 [Streptomyces sp. CS057]|nr:hypothetical protein B9W61_18925 [Streptomyces sp. CS057]
MEASGEGRVAERFFPGAPTVAGIAAGSRRDRLADLDLRAAREVYPLFVIREGESGGGEGFVGDALGNSGLATL